MAGKGDPRHNVRGWRKDVLKGGREHCDPQWQLGVTHGIYNVGGRTPLTVLKVRRNIVILNRSDVGGGGGGTHIFE